MSGLVASAATRHALAEQYVVTLGALLCVESPPFASAAGRCFAVLTVEGGGFRVTTDRESTGAVCDRIVIPPGVGYSVADSTAYVLRFLVEPGGNVGRRLRYALSSEAKANFGTWIDTARRLVEKPLTSAIRRGTWQAVVRNTFARIDRPAAPQSGDVVLLQRLVGAMERDVHGRVATTTLAARLGVSADRLSQTLSRHVGLPTRQFIQWYRLLQYARFVARGDSPEWAARSTGLGGWTKLIELGQRTFGLHEVDFAATERWSAAADALV